MCMKYVSCIIIRYHSIEKYYLSMYLDNEESIDVYQICKLYHNKRPGVWRSQEDYLYIYRYTCIYTWERISLIFSPYTCNIKNISMINITIANRY